MSGTALRAKTPLNKADRLPAYWRRQTNPHINLWLLVRRTLRKTEADTGLGQDVRPGKPLPEHPSRGLERLTHARSRGDESRQGPPSTPQHEGNARSISGED